MKKNHTRWGLSAYLPKADDGEFISPEAKKVAVELSRQIIYLEDNARNMTNMAYNIRCCIRSLLSKKGLKIAEEWVIEGDL